MSTLNIFRSIFWLSVLTSSSGILSAQTSQEEMKVKSNKPDSLSKKDISINMFFNEINKDRITGSVNYIDAESEFSRDSRYDIGSALSGKVPGIFDVYNIWGTGDAIVLVDGIPQNDFYLQNLNLMEVETIEVLKDAVSKAMYGALGDQGVILINTKRGKAGANRIRVSAQQSIQQPRALPKFLHTADYMEKYNEALINDGLTPIYSQDSIDMTRSATSPAIYPDNDFYSEKYLRNFISTTNLIFDMSGGNQNAQYYLNTEWVKEKGLLNTTIPDVTNYFNFRGNLDFKINDYMKMGINGVARLSANERPNVTLATGESDYWSKFSNILPNAYPALWDPNLIADSATRSMVLNEAVLHNGMVLGGNSTYANNQIYGELFQNGRINYRQSITQFSGKLDVDLSFITKGLTAKVLAAMNFYNTLYSEQLYDYAIYEPLVDSLGVIDTVKIHGSDIPRDQFNTNNDLSTFTRQLNYYSTLGYDRNFGKHEISALALIYATELTREGSFQKQVFMHTGVSLNYMYNNRYVIEGSLMEVGSAKLPSGEKFEPAPAAGLAWIISEENFMKNLSFVNYLKLRASYGVTKNDNWGTDDDAFYRYTSTFNRGSNYTYANGSFINGETTYSTVDNLIYLQKREDISAGFEATLFDNSLHLELGYFQSNSIGNLTGMTYTYPQLIGFENLVYANYNSDKNTGLELGLDYSFKLAEELEAKIGGTLLNVTPVITRIDEPIYEGLDKGLMRNGTATDAIWGLVTDGLYSESDFNPDGSLIEGLPVPTFGSVQPGDIKYLDQNEDNIIDQLDQRIVGHGIRTQFSAYIDLRYRNFGFFALGIGRMGGSNTRNEYDADGVEEGYFQIAGNVKYSEYALQAYGPNNKDVNAIHPRLSTTTGGNNDRNSNYWVYKNNSFTIPTVQLSYYFKGKNSFSFLKDSQIFLRGGNLLVLGKNKAYTEVSPYSAPKTRSYQFGIVASF